MEDPAQSLSKEEVCDYCLTYIICREHSISQHFMCEGDYCEEAREGCLERKQEML